ncbi:MAG: endonuclease III domain-containing protein [Nanobdellota archaeon]
MNYIKKVLDILYSEYNGASMLASFTDKTPFQILIATVLSARSRDEQIIKLIPGLFSKYPDAGSMAKADLKILESKIKSSGFYKTKAIHIREISRLIITRFYGIVPDNIDDLLTLPGVGRKTAGCVLVYAFKKPAIPVDTHVHRVANRLGWVDTNHPDKTEEKLMQIVPKKYWIILNEVMVVHGRKICQPGIPICSNCIINSYCNKNKVGKRK